MLVVPSHKANNALYEQADQSKQPCWKCPSVWEWIHGFLPQFEHCAFQHKAVFLQNGYKDKTVTKGELSMFWLKVFLSIGACLSAMWKGAKGPDDEWNSS